MDYQKILTDILQANVDAGREVGAQVCLMKDGKLLADVAVGNMGPGLEDRPVQSDTLFPVFSTGKAFFSTAALRMVERGELELDMPVREIWPEFACNGKENVTVRHIFMHRSGVCVRPYYREIAEINDWNLMRSRVEQHEAKFTPGTATRYQTVNYGWLLGELMLRRDPAKRDLRTIIQEEALQFSDPREIWFGVDDEAAAKTVTLVEYEFPEGIPADPPPWDYELSLIMNTDSIRRDCLPGFNCIASARGMAAHFDALLQGKILQKSTMDAACVDISKPGDIASHGLGYAVFDNGRRFGHGGYGGSFAGCDRETGISYGYTRVKMGPGPFHDQLMALIAPGAESVDVDLKTGQRIN